MRRSRQGLGGWVGVGVPIGMPELGQTVGVAEVTPGEVTEEAEEALMSKLAVVAAVVIELQL